MRRVGYIYNTYCLNVACLSDFHKTKNGWRDAFSFKYSWLMKCFVCLCGASDNIYMFLLSISCSTCKQSAAITMRGVVGIVANAAIILKFTL